MVRLCPNALPRLPQGLVLAMQVTLGNILDPYSYAPSTAQEWLYPSLLLEHGGPFVGYIPPLVSAQVPAQVLATAALPVCSGGAQLARQQRTVDVLFSFGAGFGISCVHACCRGILTQWMMLICLVVLPLGITWRLCKAEHACSGFRSFASVIYCHCLGLDVVWSVRKLGRLDGRRRDCSCGQRACGPKLSRQHSERCLRRKGCFLLWLVLTPSAHGVQMVRQGAIHGQPVFSTGTVPGTRNLHDLRPVRIPNMPVTGARVHEIDDGYRDICVFAPDLRMCHVAPVSGCAPQR